MEKKGKSISDLTPAERVELDKTLMETERMIDQVSEMKTRIRENLLKVASIMGLGEELTGKLDENPPVKNTESKELSNEK